MITCKCYLMATLIYVAVCLGMVCQSDRKLIGSIVVRNVEATCLPF